MKNVLIVDIKFKQTELTPSAEVRVKRYRSPYTNEVIDVGEGGESEVPAEIRAIAALYEENLNLGIQNAWEVT